MDFTKPAENLMGVRIIRSNFYSPVRKKESRVDNVLRGGWWLALFPSLHHVEGLSS